MFKKSIKLMGLILVFGLVSILGITRPAAASASISVRLNRSSVVVGNTVTATVTISSGAALGSWQFDIGYDTSRLQLTSSSFGGAHVADVVQNTSTRSKSYTFTFKALKSGTASISVKNSGGYAYDESSLSMSNGSSSVRIMTQAELEASYSKNNYLSSLSVEGATLSPAFNKETLEYTVELEPETTNIKVNATKEDSKASVRGTGDIAVTEGDNNIKIVVTAENGNERTYTINAKVKELSPVNVKVGKEDYTVVRKKGAIETPQGYKEVTIKINNEDVPAFESEITKMILVGLKDKDGNTALYVYDSKKNTYTLYKEIRSVGSIIYPMELDKNVVIPDGYKKYKEKIGEQEFEIYKLSKSNKYGLIYGINIETGKKGLYLYDFKEGTLQRYYQDDVKNLNDKIKTYSYVIIGAGIGLLVLCLILIILCIRLMKVKKQLVSVKKRSMDMSSLEKRQENKKNNTKKK